MKNEIESKIHAIFTRGIGEFIDPDGSFRKKLVAKASGKYDKDIIIKYGVDPTRPDIHLGHAVCFRKLRQLQDLGCKVVFLVGDFTAMIGDPTGKSQVRPEVEQKEVEKNVNTYLEQIERILLQDEKYFSWIRNSDWFSSPSDYNLPDDFKFVCKIPGTNEDTILSNKSIITKAYAFEASRMAARINPEQGVWNISIISLLWSLKNITQARLIKRDMFQKRIAENDDLYMHEMLYPIFQGIDSYAINRVYKSCDLEVGGTDQTFNMLIGRDAQKINKKQLEDAKYCTDLQAVISLELLEGTDGREKMSKSLDNYIAITEEPNSMFGKVMSIPDSSMMNYFELCTEISLDEAKKDIANNPRDAKVKLAREIVRIYHNETEAEKAEQYFVNTFSKKEMPSEIKEIKVEKEEINILDFLVLAETATSKGDARRKIEQGGVELNGEKITDWKIVLTKKDSGAVVKVGKIHFVKIRFE